MDLSSRIKVASQNSARRLKRKFDAVITIEDPNIRHPLRFHGRPHPEHMVLQFEDIDDPSPDFAMVHEKHVIAALQFAEAQKDKSLLIHCKAGIARSTAMALAVLSLHLGKGKEDQAVQTLLHIRNEAVPNLEVLKLSDKALGRDGKLIDAWMAIENSKVSYAHIRNLKRKMLRDNPALFSPSVPVEGTIFTFNETSLSPSYWGNANPLSLSS